MNKSKESGKFFATIQQVGKSFFLPVSVLPIAGLLLGLGSSFTNQTTIETYNLTGLLGSGTVLNGLLTIMSQVGTAIFGNLPLIFALAVALGMARKEKAVAVLSSGIAFIVMHTSINAMLKLSGYILPDGSQADFVLQGQLSSVLGITSLEMGVFGGIIVGLGVAALHNKFYKQELPMALSFFSGVRFVPIISTIVYIFVGILCFFVWPFVQSGIFTLGNLVTASGYAGTFIFGFLERALIPFGLHHVFYIPFWQTALGGTATIDGVVVAGAQNIFFAELASPNTVRFSVDACRFMSGKYSFMMAGLPAAAYAMYKCARPENKKVVAGLLFSAGLTSFLTGITEPIDFTLYGLLQGPTKTNWPMMLVLFVIYAIGYYLIFSFLIKKFNIMTPGREENSTNIKLYTKEDLKNKNNTKSELILEGVGGVDNLVDIDACATRLRLTVVDENLVNEELLKESGSKGLIKKGKGIQIIYGPQVTVIKSDFEEYVEKVSQ